MIEERRGAHKRLDKYHAGYRNKESVYCLPKKNLVVEYTWKKGRERKRTNKTKNHTQTIRHI
jgi:hypothetical protein